MKPDWGKDAPPWANFAAMDLGGHWSFYERAPFIDGSDEHWSHKGFACNAFCRSENYSDWRNSLQKRPNHIPNASKMMEEHSNE